MQQNESVNAPVNALISTVFKMSKITEEKKLYFIIFLLLIVLFKKSNPQHRAICSNGCQVDNEVELCYTCQVAPNKTFFSKSS